MRSSFFGVILFVLALILLTAVPLQAASVGFPSIVSKEDAELGQAIEMEVVYCRTLDRQLKASNTSKDNIQGGNGEHVKVAYTRLKEVQPYVKFGISQFDEKMTDLMITGLGRRDVDFNYDMAFSYGGGIGGTYDLSLWDLFLGYDLQYLRSEHGIGNVDYIGSDASNQIGVVRFEEWHIAGLVGKEFPWGMSEQMKLTPYGGMRYSQMRRKVIDTLKFNTPDGLISISGSSVSKRNFGLILGANLGIESHWRLGFEGDFVDGAALSVSGKYIF